MEDKPRAAPPAESQATLLALAAVLLWSTVAVGFKLGLQQMSVTQLLWVACTVSWCVFFIYCVWRKQFLLLRQDWRLAVLLGCINPAAYYLVLFAAYNRLPAHIAQPLNYTWAITLALLAVPVLKQSLTTRMITGMLISYVGVAILLFLPTATSTEHTDRIPWDSLGIGLALGSTVLWAAYWLLNTRSQSPPGALMFWSFTTAWPLLTALCTLGPGFPPWQPSTLLYGAWIGCFEMGVTFLLWQDALRRTAHTARISQLIFLSPFLSLWLIRWQLNEAVTGSTFLALAIIVLGLQVSRPKAQQPGVIKVP